MHCECDFGRAIGELVGYGRKIGCGICCIAEIAIDEKLGPKNAFIFAVSSDGCSDGRFSRAGVACKPQKPLGRAGDVMQPIPNVRKDIDPRVFVTRKFSLIIIVGV
jgi:hypothetical protein